MYFALAKKAAWQRHLRTPTTSRHNFLNISYADTLYSGDLDRDPMTLIHEPDLVIPNMSRVSRSLTGHTDMLFASVTLTLTHWLWYINLLKDSDDVPAYQNELLG